MDQGNVRIIYIIETIFTAIQNVYFNRLTTGISEINVFLKICQASDNSAIYFVTISYDLEQISLKN